MDEPTRKTPKVTGRLSRRTVVLGAGAAAGGLAVSRVLGLHAIGPDPRALLDATSAPVVNTKDWVSPLDRPEAEVAQLLRRATFGMTKAQYETAVGDGFQKTVDRLIETPAAMPKDLSGADAASQAKPINVTALQSWWLDQMLATSSPFAERMTYFWHGHFTSDFRKVSTQAPYIYWQNLTWRKNALGSFRDLLYQVTVDPGMLRYLDLGQSTGKAPNENYSRELMELFTMGAGNFSEEDVRQSAKALAGWQVPQPDSYATVVVDKANNVTRKLPVFTSQKSGVFNARRAFKGNVTYLGKTGPLDTQGVIDRILAQPATAAYIATKVARHFVTTQPDVAYVKGLADTFRRSKYDMKTLMHAVFMSPQFNAAQSYRTLVKTPTEFMVHAARALGEPKLSRLVAGAGSGMGQSLFDPPDVNGWPTNEAWISSNTVVERVNFVTAAMSQVKKSLPAASDAPRTQLDGVLSPQTAKLLNQAADDRARWFITLASPEFQLK